MAGVVFKKLGGDSIPPTEMMKERKDARGIWVCTIKETQWTVSGGDVRRVSRYLWTPDISYDTCCTSTNPCFLHVFIIETASTVGQKWPRNPSNCHVKRVYCVVENCIVLELFRCQPIRGIRLLHSIIRFNLMTLGKTRTTAWKDC